MISPLAQRQMFQTANLEALRAAHELSDHLQREAARQKAIDDHHAEEQAGVHLVPGSESIRTEERHGGRQQEASKDEGKEDGGSGETETPGSVQSAGPADPHIDFLA